MRSRWASLRKLAPVMAAAPSMTTAASKNRAVRSSNGGQSVSARLATENAELQSGQKVATRSGSGTEVADDAMAARADIGISTNCRDRCNRRRCHLEIK